MPYDARRPPFRQKKGSFRGKSMREQRETPDRDDGLQVLYGYHSVIEALANPRRKPEKLIVTENALLRIREALDERGSALTIEPIMVEPEAISRQLTADAVHQGMMLLAAPLQSLDLDEILMCRLTLALDQITDPHNVGAILRTAAAFGVEAIVTTERHSAHVTGVLAKSASGALEHVPFCIVRNLSHALEALKSVGTTLVGLDSEAEGNMAEARFQQPLCLVLGAEGKGLRQKTRELVDHMVRLDMPGAIKSLNVSNAAAIALYAVTTQKR
jgi:23S rRNA (guanosine2251-2'-O)-methyltransferase